MEWSLPHPNCSPPNIVLVTMANSFPQTPPTSSLHPTRLHCISQTPHRDSFSTCAPNPFLLPSLAANTSPLPGSFAPQNLFKRARHSTSSNTLFTLSLPLQHFFPPLLLTHSFLLSKTPHGRTQTRPAGSSAPQTMPQPTPSRNPCHALHSPVSLPTSPWLSSPPLRSNHIKSY